MSSKAIRRSSSCTFSAGISPLTMRQKRQLDMSALSIIQSGAGHDGARDALQIGLDLHQFETGGCQEFGYRAGLTSADLHQQNAPARQGNCRTRDQEPDQVQSVVACKQ